MRRVLANSVPKAGTFLLQRCLLALPGAHDAHLHLDLRQSDAEQRTWLALQPDGAVVTGHLVHEPRFVSLVHESDVAHVLIVRDPRDVAVSYAEYAARATHHYLHAHFAALEPAQRLLAAIVGVPGDVPWDSVALRDVGAVFGQFLPWRDEPGTLVVRFEDLVGPAGAGAAATQRATVARLAAHVGVELDGPALELAAARVFDPSSPTFRRGESGAWRERFGPEHLAAFERVADGLLAELGYDQAPAWPHAPRGELEEAVSGGAGGDSRALPGGVRTDLGRRAWSK